MNLQTTRLRVTDHDIDFCQFKVKEFIRTLLQLAVEQCYVARSMNNVAEKRAAPTAAHAAALRSTIFNMKNGGNINGATSQQRNIVVQQDARKCCSFPAPLIIYSTTNLIFFYCQSFKLSATILYTLLNSIQAFCFASYYSGLNVEYFIKFKPDRTDTRTISAKTEIVCSSALEELSPAKRCSQLEPSYKIKTCIDRWPNGTAKSSQLARNHSIV